MRQPVTITGPIGTTEDLARSYGVPLRRAKELIRLVEESLAKKANGRNSVKNRARANGKAGSATRKPSRRKAARAKAKSH